MADRLQSWAEKNNLMGEWQKGFTSFCGVFDHVDTVKMLTSDARFSSKKHAIGFIDFANAFPSVSNDLLFRVFDNLGMQENPLSLLKSYYNNSFASLVGSEEKIPVERGVKQGCPASGILFNIFLGTIINQLAPQWQNKGYIMNGQKISWLAYADDLCLIANSSTSLDHMISDLNSLATS